MKDAYEESGTPEPVSVVVATRKEGWQRKRYLVIGQTGRSFQRDWQSGFKAPTRASTGMKAQS